MISTVLSLLFLGFYIIGLGRGFSESTTTITSVLQTSDVRSRSPPWMGDNMSEYQRTIVESTYGGSDYAVSIRRQGSEVWLPLFAYKNENPRGVNWYQTTASNQWVSFDLSGTTQIKVAMKGGKRVTGLVRLKPERGVPAIAPGIDGSVMITLDSPGQFWVQIPGQEKHPLFLFVNPKETDVPKESDTGVKIVDNDANYRELFAQTKQRPDCELVIFRFTPGLHFIGNAKEVLKKRNFTLYVPYGSVLVGTFTDSDLTDVTFRGRGIIDGGHGRILWRANAKGYDKPRNVGTSGGHHENLTDFTGKGERVTIEGLTMLSTRGFLVRCFSENSRYDNLKLMGWSYNTDGVGLYRNATCTNSFFKVNDDCLKLGSGLVSNCVIWQQHNAHVFVSRIWSKSELRGVVVFNCDIIHREQGFGGSVFAIRGHLGGGEYHHFRFENIRIDCDVDRFMDFAPTREYFPDKLLQAHDPSLPRTDLHHFLFKKILWNGRAKRPSWFRCGLKGSVHHIIFEDCIINGKKLTSIHDLSKKNGFHSFTGYGDVRNICFIADGREIVHKSPADELGGWQVKTANGIIPVFAIDGVLPEGSFREDADNQICKIRDYITTP